MRIEELNKRPHAKVEGTENVWRVRTGSKGGWVMYIERDACKYCGDPFVTHLSDLLKRPDKSGRFCCSEHYYLHRKSEQQLPLPIRQGKPRKYTRRKQTSVKPKTSKESLMLQRPEVQRLVKPSAISKPVKKAAVVRYDESALKRLGRIEDMLNTLMNELGVEV